MFTILLKFVRVSFCSVHTLVDTVISNPWFSPFRHFYWFPVKWFSCLCHRTQNFLRCIQYNIRALRVILYGFLVPNQSANQSVNQSIDESAAKPLWSSVHVMACHLISAKPLPEPKFNQCWIIVSWTLSPQERISVKLEHDNALETVNEFENVVCKWQPFCLGLNALK